VIGIGKCRIGGVVAKKKCSYPQNSPADIPWLLGRGRRTLALVLSCYPRGGWPPMALVSVFRSDSGDGCHLTQAHSGGLERRAAAAVRALGTTVQLGYSV